MSESLYAQILSREWFYAFRLPDGRRTVSYLPADVEPIHRWRRQMLFDYLDQTVAGAWGRCRAIDLGCHEGFFSVELARRGCREVVGFDARREHVEHADLIRRVFGLDNLRFQQAEVLAVDPGSLGEFDITVMFGLLYHLPDIVGALRQARALTRGVCVIETQIAPELTGSLEWGAEHFRKDIVGSFALVDEQSELDHENREANISRISLVPSLRGLLWLLEAVGFDQAEVLPPPAGAYEQLSRGQRVIVVATAGPVGDPSADDQ